MAPSVWRGPFLLVLAEFLVAAWPCGRAVQKFAVRAQHTLRGRSGPGVGRGASSSASRLDRWSRLDRATARTAGLSDDDRGALSVKPRAPRSPSEHPARHRGRAEPCLRLQPDAGEPDEELESRQGARPVEVAVHHRGRAEPHGRPQPDAVGRSRTQGSRTKSLESRSGARPVELSAHHRGRAEPHGRPQPDAVGRSRTQGSRMKSLESRSGARPVELSAHHRGRAEPHGRPQPDAVGRSRTQGSRTKSSSLGRERGRTQGEPDEELGVSVGSAAGRAGRRAWSRASGSWGVELGVAPRSGATSLVELWGEELVDAASGRTTSTGCGVAGAHGRSTPLTSAG